MILRPNYECFAPNLAEVGETGGILKFKRLDSPIGALRKATERCGV